MPPTGRRPIPRPVEGRVCDWYERWCRPSARYVYEALDEREIDYVVTVGDDRFADDSVVEVLISDDAVDAVFAEEAGLSTVAVRSEYADYSPFTGPETVHVEVRRVAVDLREAE